MSWNGFKRIVRMLLALLLISIMIPSVITVKHAYDKVMTWRKTEQQVVEKEQKYLQALELLVQEKWTDAESILQGLKDYKDAKVLTIYARVRELIKNKDYNRAWREFSKIPNGYNGQFKPEIVQLSVTLNQLPGTHNNQLQQKIGGLKDQVTNGLSDLLQVVTGEN